MYGRRLSHLICTLRQADARPSQDHNVEAVTLSSMCLDPRIESDPLLERRWLPNQRRGRGALKNISGNFLSMQTTLLLDGDKVGICLSCRRLKRWFVAVV